MKLPNGSLHSRSVAIEPGDVNAVLTKHQAFGEDSALQPYLPGLLASITVLQALDAYQSQPDPTLTVMALSKQALSELRSMLLPAALKQSTSTLDPKRPLGRAKSTISAPVKATVKPAVTSRTVSAKAPLTTKANATSSAKRATSNAGPGSSPLPMDAAPTLASHLAALISLLGVLGLTLQKVECLKVFRALFRSDPEVVDEYIALSAQLAFEYADLGKVTRANTVFAQAIRVVEDSETSIAPHVVSLLYLRYCIYLAMMRRVDEAIHAYNVAATFAKQVDESETTRYFRQTLEWLERGILAREAVASISHAQVS